jgi:kynurenine formamidase
MALPDYFHELARKVSNWGRWGDDDEIGTINLITPDVMRRAAGCVRTGKSFSLALPLSEAEGIQTGLIPGRLNPTRTMVAINTPFTGDPSEFCTSDDLVVMGLQAATHWDGLGHVSYDGRIYNGYPADSIGAFGATKCGIHQIRTLVSRGILLDVARAKGVDRLEGGYALTADDLDAAEERAGVRVEAGDVVLVRTGQMQFLRQGRHDKVAYSTPAPGPSLKTVEWFRDRDVAAVATDNLTFEVFPCEDPAAQLPVHLLHIVQMGLTQGQNWQLEELADDCADDGVYEFLLDASPQPFTNAVGSPVNPVALK